MWVLHTHGRQCDKGILLDLFPLEHTRFSREVRRITLSRITSYFFKKNRATLLIVIGSGANFQE